jgi:ribosomal protein L32
MPDVTPIPKAPKKPASKWKRPMRQVSEKRAEKFDLHAALRAKVIARDGGCVLHGETDRDCIGRNTVHHRRKASACGAWSLKNLVCLCWGHNTDIENRPDYYRDRWPWLVVRPGDAEYESLKAKR